MSSNGVDHRTLDRNQLDARKSFQLAQAIQAIKDELMRDRPSREVVARRMEKQLGFKVTVPNVAKASKACGVVWRTHGGSRKAARPGGDWYSRLARLEWQMAQAIRLLNAISEDLGMGKIGDAPPMGPEETDGDDA